MNKNIVFIVLVILFLTGGLVGYKVGEVACQEIIDAQDVVHKFKIGGIILKPETSLHPKEYKVKDTEPIIYTDSQGDILFIYTFSSFVERQRNFEEDELSKGLLVTLNERNYLSKHYRVKNLQLVYLIADPPKENTQAVRVFLRKAEQVYQLIFTELNGGKDVLFTGESPSWEGKVVVSYYEHWWTDIDNIRRYENYSEAGVTTFTYKGQIPEQAIPIEYSIVSRRSSDYQTHEITPEMLRHGIKLGGGSVPIPRENDTYEVKIILAGKTEEFVLKPGKIDDR